MLKDKGAHIADTLTWSDHHWYTADDMLEIEKAAAKVAMVVTTEKDMVKMKPSERLADKLYALRIETKWLETPPEVVSELSSKLAVKSESINL